MTVSDNTKAAESLGSFVQQRRLPNQLKKLAKKVLKNPGGAAETVANSFESHMGALLDVIKLYQTFERLYLGTMFSFLT